MFIARLLGLCLIAAALGLAWPVRADDSAAAREQLNALRDRIDAVRHKIAADSHQRSKLSDALNEAADEISAARKRLDTLDERIAEDKRHIVRLTDRRDAERDRLKGELDDLRAQVQAAYENGRISRMRLLLSGESPARVGRMLGYYRYFAAAQTGQVNRLRGDLAELARRQQALETEQQALATQRDARAQTLTDLKEQRKQQQVTIAALDRQLSAHKNSLADMRADEKRLEDLLGSVRKQLSSLPPVPTGVPFSKLKGRLRPPVSGPVLAGYGQTKNGGPLTWQGEWIGAANGTPIRAVADGRVVYVGYMKRYGLIVIIDNGHDYYTLYGHAAASYVDVGQQVKGGQPIATAGTSGGHDRSGAYFEIRHGQTPVNPASWLTG